MNFLEIAGNISTPRFMFEKIILVFICALLILYPIGKVVDNIINKKKDKIFTAKKLKFIVIILVIDAILYFLVDFFE